MPASRKTKKKPKEALKNGKATTVSKNSRSNNQTNISASPVSDPFKDPEPSTGSSRDYEFFNKSSGRGAQQDDWEIGSGGAPVDKSGKTMNVWTAIMQLRGTVMALDTINRECLARCNDLEKDGEMDANKLSVLEELVSFLAFKMDAHLDVVNHIRVLGHRPVVTAEDLYRAGLWPHEVSLEGSENGNEQPSLTDLPNTGKEPSPSSQTAPPKRDDTVAPMSSRSDEPTALTKTESSTKSSISFLLNDDPPGRYQGSSQPSRNYDLERVEIETPTAEDHDDLLAEIEKLKKQTRDVCLDVVKCNDLSGKLIDNSTDRSRSIARIQRRVGLMYLVSRLHVGDQKAPDDVWDVPIDNEISTTGEGFCVKALMEAVLLDTTKLANDNDARITSLDNVTNSQLDERLTREGSSISGPQGGLSDRRVKEISTTTQNVSQDQNLDGEEGKSSCRSLKQLSEETADTSMNKSVHKAVEGQILQKAESSQKIESQQDEIEELARLHDEIRLLQNVVGEAFDNGVNGSSEKQAFASAADAFLRNLATSLTEQDKTIGGEMLEDLMKENAKLTEKMKVLASVDLLIEGSRLKLRVMRDDVGSQLAKISSPANGTSIGKALVEAAKPDREPIKNKRSDSKEGLRPQDLADRIEIAPSHGSGQHLNMIKEGNTAAGGLQHQIPKSDSSCVTLNLTPHSADMPSGLLAREDAALVLASIKNQAQDQSRLPPQVDSIEDQQPTNDDVHDKSTWQDLSTSQSTWMTSQSGSQSGKQNGHSGLQGEIFKTKPQVEFNRAATEGFHDVIFFSQLKDQPQPVVDKTKPTHPDVAEDVGQAKSDRRRKHDGQLRKADSLTQLGTNTTAEMPLRLNGCTRDSELFTADEDGEYDEYCQLNDVTNDTKVAEGATSNDFIKLTAQSETVKGEEDSVVSANSPQEKPSCLQSSSTTEKARQARDEDYEADSEWETKVVGKTATLHAPQEVQYDYYGCDHPFL